MGINGREEGFGGVRVCRMLPPVTETEQGSGLISR